MLPQKTQYKPPRATQPPTYLIPTYKQTDDITSAQHSIKPLSDTLTDYIYYAYVYYWI